jgi:hypothetical protein
MTLPTTATFRPCGYRPGRLSICYTILVLIKLLVGVAEKNRKWLVMQLL